MKTIINNIEYNTASQYTEPNGTLRLVLIGDFSLDELKDNISETDDIKIYSDENLIATYSEYNTVRQINTILFDGTESQVEIVIAFNNIFLFVDKTERKLAIINSQIAEIIDKTDALEINTTTLTETLNSILTDVEELKDRIASLENPAEEL